MHHGCIPTSHMHAEMLDHPPPASTRISLSSYLHSIPVFLHPPLFVLRRLALSSSYGLHSPLPLGTVRHASDRGQACMRVGEEPGMQHACIGQ